MERALLKPRRLRPGDNIGVIAPAGAVDSEALDQGIAAIEARGFGVRRGAALGERHRYLAGSDAARLRDLEDMIRDPAVAAVIAARGGYGSGRLLPGIDPELFRQNPKAIVGHSDLTFLLNDVVQRAGLVAFHGPMVSQVATQPAALEALLGVLGGDIPAFADAPVVLRAGRAEGPIVGGCLSIVVAMLGTPYALRTRGRLLFLEDVKERPYRMDRMLIQLKQAGALDGIAGMVFGETPGCFDQEDTTLGDLLLEVCADTDFPIVAGVPSGHGQGLVTVPLGIEARLDGARFTLSESPFAD